MKEDIKNALDYAKEEVAFLPDMFTNEHKSYVAYMIRVSYLKGLNDAILRTK